MKLMKTLAEKAEEEEEEEGIGGEKDAGRKMYVLVSEWGNDGKKEQ